MKNTKAQKIWVATCECGKSLAMDEKPHQYSLIKVNGISGVFPIRCACGKELNAADFKHQQIEI